MVLVNGPVLIVLKRSVFYFLMFQYNLLFKFRHVSVQLKIRIIQRCYIIKIFLKTLILKFPLIESDEYFSAKEILLNNKRN